MLIFIDAHLQKELKERLSFSVLKASKNDPGYNTASVAIGKDDSMHFGGRVESDSNVLDITSEQTALLLAAQRGNFSINRVMTLAESESPIVSPLVLKILADWSIRTSIPLSYTLVTKSGVVFFETNNVLDFLSWYTPLKRTLTLPANIFGANFETNTDSELTTLKHFAQQGLSRAFHTYDGATAYGAAVRTKSGTIYYTSQYSSPDKRLGIHAEIAAIVSAFMHGEKDITHLSLLSPKFKEVPCVSCGACRQFIGEFAKKLRWDLKVHCFASESDQVLSFTADELIPHLWAS